MIITVLYGGPSAEREVSLVSGKAVASALREAGHTILEHDIQPSELAILEQKTDVVFPVLHGAWGESGELQEILEARGLPFVGSGSKAARLGMNKVDTKRAWEAAGIPTPKYAVITEKKVPFDGPCVVKAIDSGSSIDVIVCKDPSLAPRAIDQIISKHGRALVEQFISGPELTVGLLEEEPLAPIRIIAKAEFFDFEAKYKSNATEHRFDTGLSPQLIKKCQDLAKRANEVVGARDLARVDIMISDKNEPFLLEINTMPGFTPKSLLPEAANHAGVNFVQLVDRLAKRAQQRGAIVRAA